VSRANGVTEAQLRDLQAYRESEAFSALEKLVLDYTVALTITPVEVSDDLFAYSPPCGATSTTLSWSS
jgi:alkylhydroperoxidase family enzyme